MSAELETAVTEEHPDALTSVDHFVRTDRRIGAKTLAGRCAQTDRPWPGRGREGLRGCRRGDNMRFDVRRREGHERDFRKVFIEVAGFGQAVVYGQPVLRAQSCRVDDVTSADHGFGCVYG
jgi:hypothetical protein